MPEARERLDLTLKAVKEARKNLKILAEIAGELTTQPVVSILINPQSANPNHQGPGALPRGAGGGN